MDHRNPSAQTEYVGRRHTAEIVFYLDRDATEEQVEEWLAYEIFGGSIATNHPLQLVGIGDGEVTNVRAESAWKYTDWEAADADGRRTGRVRIERTPRPQSSDSDRLRYEAAMAEMRAAQAIEARRAETQSGSVHESAVPQECAREVSHD